MARKKLLERLRSSNIVPQSFLRTVMTGSFYKLSDIRSNSDIADIHTQIDTMRGLARDSQISTALSYYATDATIPNSSGQIIWATPKDESSKEAAQIVNDLFLRWNITAYARDHVLELATIGNLYIPTTLMFKDESNDTDMNRKRVALDNNTIPEATFDIIPSKKVLPEDIVDIWLNGQQKGYILQPDEGSQTGYTVLPPNACIHFSLGGMLGDYSMDTVDSNGEVTTYDIKFAQPMMSHAVQPTQTLSLLEDAVLLSSLTRTVRFVNVNCGSTADEEEIRQSLQDVKDAIEQQISINTATGDTQSFVNPQSPNNLIFLPKINGEDPISITDLNMAEASDTDNKLLDHFQDKKLSVLGIPKEAMNFSSNEGLGGAGSVMSQRSALYANLLQRIETAYKYGWREAINTYFIQRGMSGLVDQYELNMSPIITNQSTIQFDKRDSALNQATSLVDLLKSLNIDDRKDYTSALTEILKEAFPEMGVNVSGWGIDVTGGEDDASEF